jgi:uncharacterized protein YqhQ
MERKMNNLNKQNALKILRAALVVAVAIASGVVVLAVAGPVLVLVMTIVAEIVVGIALGTLVYNLAEKFIDRVWQRKAAVVDWRSIRNVVYPFGGAPLEE